MRSVQLFCNTTEALYCASDRHGTPVIAISHCSLMKFLSAIVETQIGRVLLVVGRRVLSRISRQGGGGVSKNQGSLPFPSLPFPSLPFPSLPFPPHPSLNLVHFSLKI